MIIYRGLCFLIGGIAFSIGSHAGAADPELELPLFRDLWANSISLPGDMPKPSLLHGAFAAEPRVIDWALSSETEINSALSRIQAGQVSARQVQCHRTICEVIFLVPHRIATDKGALDKEIQRSMNATALSLGKEITMALGGGKPGVTGALVYFHDEGAGLK